MEKSSFDSGEFGGSKELELLFSVAASIEEKLRPMGKDALCWYMEEARKGVPEAQFIQGVMRHAGVAVKRSISKAVELYKKSA